jgi:hypothetical protein
MGQPSFEVMPCLARSAAWAASKARRSPRGWSPWPVSAVGTSPRGEGVEDRAGALGVLVPGVDELSRLVAAILPAVSAALIARVAVLRGQRRWAGGRPGAGLEVGEDDAVDQRRALRDLRAVRRAGSARSSSASSRAARMVASSADSGSPSVLPHGGDLLVAERHGRTSFGWVDPSADAVGGLGVCALQAARAAGEMRTSRSHAARARHVVVLVVEVDRGRLGGGADGDDGADPVGELGGDGLVGGVPGAVGLGGHRGAPLLGGAAGAQGVDAGHVGALLVEEVGVLAELLGVAHREEPRVVDHHLGAGRHDDLVAGDRDDRGGGGGQPVDDDGDVALWLRNRLPIAMPWMASPPGELSRTVMWSTLRPRSWSATVLSLKPNQ